MPSTIFDTKDSVFFVGGRGTKAGDANAGGGCTAALWGDLKAPSKLLSDIMGTNGGPLSDAAAWNGSQTACTLSADGTGNMRITRAGCFSDCIVGLIARVHTTGVTPADVNDRFEVIGVDPGGDYIDVNADWVAGGTGDVKVGGAFDKLQTAADETTADSMTDAHNVDILTNQAQTFTAAGDQINLDVGGGDTVSGTKKRIIGIDADGVELAAGAWVTIDADGNVCHCLYFTGAEDGIELHHIAAINASGGILKAGFSFYITGKGFVLKDCKSTGCYNGIRSTTSNTQTISVIGGYYSSSSSIPIYLLNTYGIALLGVVVEGEHNNPIIQNGGYGLSVISGCVIIGNGNISCVGVRIEGSFASCITKNNVLYNVGHGFDVNSLTCGLVDVDNIIVVAEKANGKAISFTAGSVLYSDRSCLWALDGAPAAADRWGPYGMGENSIEADPLFMDAANGDFRLQSIELFGSAADSPCLNVGMPTLDKVT